MTAVFSSETIAAFIVAGVLAILIPIAALIIFKLKNKTVKLRYFFIGAAAFVVFALILEQILHVFMQSTIQNSSIAVYVLYGALCAGIFEETGRFLAFKLFFKNENDPRASIMYGLGHGGIESVILLGLTMLSYAVTAVTINAIGTDAFFGSLNYEQNMIALIQLAALAQYDIPTAFLSIVERIFAITLHVSLSVIVFASVKMKGRFWLYPAAVAIHAIFDVPAALYQRDAMSIVLCEILLALGTVVAVIIAAKVYKAMKAELAEQVTADEFPAEEPEKVNSTYETE